MSPVRVSIATSDPHGDFTHGRVMPFADPFWAVISTPRTFFSANSTGGIKRIIGLRWLTGTTSEPLSDGGVKLPSFRNWATRSGQAVPGLADAVSTSLSGTAGLPSGAMQEEDVSSLRADGHGRLSLHDVRLRLAGHIGVPDVMVDGLEAPNQLSGFGFQRDYRVAVIVVRGGRTGRHEAPP